MYFPNLENRVAQIIHLILDFNFNYTKIFNIIN